LITDWITVDEVRLETARWGCGDRLPILLLHEGLGSVRLWKDFPARLAEESSREVIAWSRQGHGWSDASNTPRETDYMHREAALLPSLMSALDIEKAHLLGHSDGASIALIGAALHPPLVDSLILEAPHVLVEELTHAAIAHVAATFLQTDMGERMRRYHQDPIALFANWSSIWLDPRFRSWTIEGLLPSIAAPALLIQGQDDEYGTLDQLGRITAKVAQAERLILGNCRHSPHFDRQDAVLSAICKFLSEKD
jgi:pimeloyl-ACP methyl ester carboxylesterase